MKALIYAQTIGSRLRPLTDRMPKPIVPVANTPSIVHTVDLLARCGVDEILVSLHDRADQIEAVLAAVSRPGCRITCVRTSLRSMGMLDMRPYLDGTFFALDSDLITDIDLADMLQFHRDRQAVATWALVPPQAAGLPCTTTAPDGRLLRVDRHAPDGPYFSGIGVKIYEMQVFDVLTETPGYPCPLEFDEYPPWMNSHPFSSEFLSTAPFLKFAEGASWFGYRSQSYGIDIGVPDRYLQAHRDLMSGRFSWPTDPSYCIAGNGIRKDERACVSTGAVLAGPAMLGGLCRIDSGAQVGPFAFLGERVTIEPGALVRDSVVWRDCHIGAGASVSNSIVPDGCCIGTGARIESTASISAGTVVLPYQVIRGNLRVDTSGLR